MRRRFVTLDVFTERRFAGNPLAVVFDAEGIDGIAMQAIAREFGHPETVFVLPPADVAHRAKLRIFTPAAEIPFAGHPTVGTAVALARLDGGPRRLVVEEGIGAVNCEASLVDSDQGRASFELPGLSEPAGPPPAVADIAAALGIDAADIGFDGFAPSRWSAGMALTFVPLNSLDAVRRCRPDLARWVDTFAADARRLVYVFSREAAESGHDFHARMFAPTIGIPEDPATGAAAAAFSGLLASTGTLGDGEHTVRIEQGYEMGRPSLIELTLSLRDGRVARATIGGTAVVVTEGAIEA